MAAQSKHKVYPETGLDCKLARICLVFVSKPFGFSYSGRVVTLATVLGQRLVCNTPIVRTCLWHIIREYCFCGRYIKGRRF